MDIEINETIKEALECASKADWNSTSDLKINFYNKPNDGSFLKDSMRISGYNVIEFKSKENNGSYDFSIKIKMNV